MRPTVSEGKVARDGLRRPVVSFSVAALACMLAAAVAATGAAAKTHARHVIPTPSTLPLRTGLLDPLFAGPERQQAFSMAAGTGATYIRLSVEWRAIAPAEPPVGFVATDPNSPGYDWSGLDSITGQLETAGLTPILDISTVPDWAYATRPRGPNGGTPTASDLGDFAKALATRYDGKTPGVPAEHVFQVWNEPNLSLDLNPVDPNAYRAMVNAVATSVHAVDPADIVVAGGLDPFGHPKKKGQEWYSTAPLAYMRSLLCLSKGTHPHSTCSTPIHFDVWSHHPYTFGGPFGHAKNPDDVELGDLPKMRALLGTARNVHHIVSARPPQFWVTEFGWDTNPPRRHAASLNLASRWTAESLHQMWLSGVSLVTWFLLEDYKSPSPYESGLYYHTASLANARAKPVLTAYRFPFVAYLGQKGVAVWGRDATSTRQVITVQRAHHKGGRWSTVATLGANGSGIFRATLKLKATKQDWLRAVAPDSGKSLAFSLTVPQAPHIGPWGN